MPRAMHPSAVEHEVVPMSSGRPVAVNDNVAYNDANWHCTMLASNRQWQTNLDQSSSKRVRAEDDKSMVPSSAFGVSTLTVG